MRSTFRRRPSLTALLVCATLLATTGASAAASAGDLRSRARVDIDAFMTALACIESGGRFNALNSRSGAYGKYQIMPRNWVAWAGRYLGDRWAEPTPRRQEFVARQRINDLYLRFGRWRQVAHWWRTGNPGADRDLWSIASRRYVGKVMRLARRAAAEGYASTIPARCFPVPFRDPKVRTEPRPIVKVTGGAVYLRLAAGYENRALTVLRRGTRLTVLSVGFDARGNYWLRVGLKDGRVGWIASWLTRPIE